MDTVSSPDLAELQAWLAEFEARNGRRLRVLHVGNVANNAYLIAKEQQRVGIDADVLSNDYYHMMATPEWEELDIRHDWGDDSQPVFSPHDLAGYQRPRFFAQGPMLACAAYLRARWEGGKEDADDMWDTLERSRLSQGVDEADLETIAHRQALTPGRRAGRPLTADFRRFARMVALLAATTVYRAARLGWRGGLMALRLAGLPRTADKIRLRLSQGALIGYLIRHYQSLQLQVEEPEKIKQLQVLVDEFAAVFPTRPDQLSVSDIAPYARDAELLAPVFANYDIVQGYGVGPIVPFVAGIRPLVAFEHGTLRDFIWENTYWGRLTALSFRKADHVFITNGDCIEHAERLGCESKSGMLHPLDVERHEARDEDAIAALRARYGASVLLFCPARHDWAIKRIDLFLRALPNIRAQVSGRVIMLLSPWGQQIEDSRRLIRELGCADAVAWLERPLCRHALIMHMQAADVVLDQMMLPAFGGIAPQALAAGTPVIMSYRPETSSWLFNEPAPILSAFTVGEIVDSVALALDLEWRALFKKRARNWVRTYHHNSRLMRDHLSVYRRILKPDLLPMAHPQRRHG